MTLLTEILAELVTQEVTCHLENDDRIFIERFEDPVWVEELSPSEVAIYSHSSEESFVYGDFDSAMNALKSNFF